MRVYSRRSADTAEHDEAPAALMRERPVTTRASLHVDRDAEVARVDVRQEFNPALLINPGSLAAPEPRPGFVQRWISDGSLESRDTSHWMKKRREGWSPRMLSTVPVSERDLYQTAKAQSGDDIVRVAGLVLCEKPIQAANARKAAISDLIKNQLQSVPESLQELRKRGDDRVGPIKVESEEHAMRGRKSATMVD